MTRTAAAKLGLGTAQFGLDYGVPTSSWPAVRDRGRDRAARWRRVAGVGLIDTPAGLYGEAEGRAGPHPAPSLNLSGW